MNVMLHESKIPHHLKKFFEPVPPEIGLEETPAAYIANLVAVFREVRRVLAMDGTCWVNLGDSYANDPKGPRSGRSSTLAGTPDWQPVGPRKKYRGGDIKRKDLIGIPWMFAFAAREDGWFLRQDIIWCLSGGAWVYAKTQKGEMPVMVKDLVRLDPSTVRLWNGQKWTQVLGWGKNPDPKGRLELVLRSGERIGCTGDHLWPTQRGNVKASELAVGDVIQTCQLPTPGLADPGHLTTDAAWFIGLYLAEGSRSDDTVQLSLNADESHWLPRLTAVARHYGGTITSALDGNSLAVRVYGRLIVALLEEYVGGTTAKDRHFKVAAWRLSNAMLRCVAVGYLDGDGHADPVNDRIRLGFARSYALERDLRTMAARLDATLTLNLATAECQTGSFPCFRGEWRWGRSGHHNEKDRGEVVAIRASKAREFWELSVEDEPHLFALTSGVLTHNCKPNPMPESVTDRCVKAHEYLFLLTKSARYFWDHAANQEPAAYAGTRRGGGKRYGSHDGIATGSGYETRTRRSVWAVCPEPYPEAHFATYPPALIRPCVEVSCPAGGVVLDPFAGSGTTLEVAVRAKRRAVGIELNPDYCQLIRDRMDVLYQRQPGSLFADIPMEAQP